MVKTEEFVDSLKMPLWIIWSCSVLFDLVWSYLVWLLVLFGLTWSYWILFGIVLVFLCLAGVDG